ncbi:thiazole synthase [Thermoproteota archaeon]
MKDKLIIAGREFESRLLLGTGKFASFHLLKSALQASGAEIVTTAVRRVDLTSQSDSFLSVIDPKIYVFLPNTSGARDAEEAVRIARIARFSGVSDWIKLEVTPEPNYLFPDPIETLKAAEILVNEGFTVLPYINADPILAKRLEEAGCATVMPLAAPIGSNQGLQTREFIQIIIEQSTVPVIVDAGLGAPSHACDAMELGADAVLVNTAIATAEDPACYAEAFKLGVLAGRKAYLAGIPSSFSKASSSSPLTGVVS